MEKDKKECEEMHELNCYETILYQLLLFNYATKKSLLLLDFSKDTIYRAVERGLEEKTISKARVNYHKVGVTRKHRTTYLTITRNGIFYLTQKCSNKMQWFKNISEEEIAKVQIKGARLPASNIERFIRASVSMQMAVEAGADGNMMYILQSDMGAAADMANDIDTESNGNDLWWLDDDSEDIEDIDDIENDELAADSGFDNCEADFETGEAQDSIPLMELVIKAKGGDLTLRNRNIKENQISFHSASDVKSTVMSSTSEERKPQIARGLMMCRFSGLLYGCYHSYIVYLSNANGMDWHDRIVRREIAAKNGYAKHIPNKSKTMSKENEGILVVRNIKDLLDIYGDKLGRRKGKEMLGKGLDRFYVLTLDRKGVEQMRYLSESDVDAEEQELIAAAVESGVYTRNEAVSAKLFPLKTQEGLLISIGTLIDIKRVDKIKAIADKVKLDYGILCEKWQIPYYEAIVPGIKYMTVS